jgi:hypothetical protein
MAVNAHAQAIFSTQVNPSLVPGATTGPQQPSAQSLTPANQAMQKWQQAQKQALDLSKQFLKTMQDLTKAIQSLQQTLVKMVPQIAAAAQHTKMMMHHASGTERHWKKIKEHAASYYDHVKGATLHLLKWTGIFGLVGGVLGSFTTLFGLSSLAAGVRAEKREAAGLGLGSGEKAVLESSFRGIFPDVGGIMSGVGRAKGNYRSPEARAFRRLGLDARTMSPFQMNQAILRRVFQIADTVPEAQWTTVLKNQHLQEFGITEETVRQAHAATPEQRRKAWAGMSPEEVKRKGLTPGAQDKWTDFANFWEDAGRRIKVALINNLDKIMPQLEKLLANIERWITDFFEGDSFEKLVNSITAGLKDFTEYLGSQQFKDDVKAFKDGFRDVVDFMKRWFGPSDPTLDPEGHPGGTDESISEEEMLRRRARTKKWWKENMPSWLGGEAKPSTELDEEGHPIEPPSGPKVRPGPGRSVNPRNFRARMGWGPDPANDNTGGARGGARTPGSGGGKVGISGQVRGTADQAMKFFIERGWSKDQAAGIVANLIEESGLDPNIGGDNGKAYGIGQWWPDRQAQFQKIFGKSIKGSSFMEQLAFVDWELGHTEAKAGNLLRGAGSARDAGAIVSRYYERPAAVQEAMNKRGGMADALVGGTGQVFDVNLNINDSAGGNVTYAAAPIGLRGRPRHVRR